MFLEKPEIILQTQYLNSVLENKVVYNLTFINGFYTTETHPDHYKYFSKSLPLLVEKVLSKGNMIYFLFHGENVLFFMINYPKYGKWSEEFDKKYSRFSLTTEENKKIYFNDEKDLGSLLFIISENEFNHLLSNIGIDIMSEEFTLENWNKILNSYKEEEIGTLLTKQHVVSGCGNRLISEVLYESRISPFRRVDNMNENEKERVFSFLRIVSRLMYNGLYKLKIYDVENGGEYENGIYYDVNHQD
jgi:formamidopyrimidine-DNA glycosylase